MPMLNTYPAPYSLGTAISRDCLDLCGVHLTLMGPPNHQMAEVDVTRRNSCPLPQTCQKDRGGAFVKHPTDEATQHKRRLMSHWVVRLDSPGIYAAVTCRLARSI